MALTLPPRKSSYTIPELARIVVWVGFRGTPAVNAVSIILAESGGRTFARNRNGPTRGCPNGSLDRGLSQINDCYHAEVSNTCAFDPYCNVSAMWRISDHGRNFHPWATFNSGAYTQFRNQAADAVIAVQRAGGIAVTEVQPGASPDQPSTLAQAIDWVLGPLNWGPIGWLKRHIKAVLLAAGNYVYGKLRPLIHDLGVGLGAAARLARHALGTAQHLYNVAMRHLHEALWNVYHWAQVGFDHLRAWTAGRLGDLANWVRREVFAPLKRAWDATVSWVRTTVIPFLKRAIDAVGHALGVVRDFLLRLIRRVAQDLKDAVKWLLAQVADAIRWVAKFGSKVWWIIDHTWDFLFYVATHPLSWWRDMWTAFVAKGSRWLVGQLLSVVAKEADAVEEFLLRYFGR